MNIAGYLAETATWVEEALDRFLPTADREPKRLHEAMRYSIFAGGKRLRPALVRAACHALGGSDEDAASSACALEMLHTYSLIHDDLPSIDNDDLRRGRPTCHKKFGDATAILAGDALQTQAFQVLAERTPRAQVIPALVLELARAAGSDGMVGGEIADIEAEGQLPDRATVEFIHERKTAALLRAAVVMGGLAAGAQGEPIEVLRDFGTKIGLAFQIVDDVLDETGTAESLGKSPGKDRATGKMSYPAVVGLEASRARARELAEAAIEGLGALQTSEILASLAAFSVTRVK